MTTLNLEHIKNKFSQKNSTELIFILTNNQDDYDKEVILIIKNLLFERGESIENLEIYDSKFHSTLDKRQNETIPLKPASFLNRFLQFIIDHFIFFGFCYILQLTMKFENNGEYEFYGLISYFLYYSISEGFFSRTIGMKIMNLKVVRFSDKNNIDIGDGISRTVGRVLNVLILQLGYIWMLFDKNKQTLIDKFSNTLVVNEK